MRRAALFLVAVCSAGCFVPPRLPPPPAAVVAAAAPGADRYATVDQTVLRGLERAIRNELIRESREPGKLGKEPLEILALSGGGMYGAFDVGVLRGWTESGKRPRFDVVTGISTGALIATFAFLGKEYDQLLEDCYVGISSDDIYHKRPLYSVLWTDALASTEPLKRRIEGVVTAQVLREVAAAHAQGRRLFVGTTNLDTRSLVIWDMGAIATEGTPEALELYRKILLASASVPAFFPPVPIDIDVGGRKYRELHADGGVTSSVFLRPYMLRLDPDNLAARVGSNLYVVSSGKLYPDPETVEPTFSGVATNAITSLLYAMTRKDVFVLYNLSLLTGMNFHLIAIPQEHPVPEGSLTFDPQEMRKLYELGYRLGVSGTGWRKVPPEVENQNLSLPRAGVRF